MSTDETYEEWSLQDYRYITKVLARVLWARERGETLEAMKPIFDEIEHWLCDDWFLDLEKSEQEKRDKFFGWE